MSTAELLDKVLEAKLKHALTLETYMMGLLPKVRRGDEAAQRTYEWYMQASKLTAFKDLLVLAKTVAPEGQGEDFDGFDDA